MTEPTDMPEKPGNNRQQDPAQLAEAQTAYGKPVIRPQTTPARLSNQGRAPVQPATAGTGVRAGFASWPEIPGPEKCNVHALHAQLLFTQWMAPEMLQHLQLRQIENVLRHAAGQSPFYHDSLAFLERLPGGALGEADFSRLPILTRRELQEFGGLVSARQRPANHGDSQALNAAGGAEGAARIMSTGLVNTWGRAMVLRDQDWHARDVSLVNLDICEDLPDKRTRQGRWSDLPWSGPSTALSADRPVEHLFKDFMRIKPHFLRVKPAMLQALLEHSISMEIRPQNLLEVICQGEYLEPRVRDEAEKAWGVPVRHIYSAPETGILALQCPQEGHLHIQAEYARVEILDDRNLPCPPGQAGRVVVTPLHNYQTPLVRYDTGHHAEAGGACRCGRSLPVLARILE